ncbi:hypothetical protein ACS0TY_008577 [Phlomoides rotata]
MAELRGNCCDTKYHIISRVNIDDQVHFGDEQVHFGGERVHINDQVHIGGEQVYFGGEQVHIGGEQVHIGGEQVHIGEQSEYELRLDVVKERSEFGNPELFITDVSGKYPRLWTLKGANPNDVRRWYNFGALASICTVAPSF